jgi:hypothetical protein
LEEAAIAAALVGKPGCMLMVVDVVVIVFVVRGGGKVVDVDQHANDYDTVRCTTGVVFRVEDRQAHYI